MMELKGSKTEENLLVAFALECQNNNKYSYYGEQAKQEGYQQIGELFLETASNERAHGKIWLDFLQEGDPRSTIQHLEDSAKREHYEWTELYTEFEKIAKQEGFENIAKKFKIASNIEHSHQQRYQSLMENMKENKVFNKSQTMVWKCRNCGHLHTGTNAPVICPMCDHPQAWFQLQSNNY